jgi:head-tail adaptor
MATAISQNDLVGAQKSFGQTLPETVTLLARSVVSDGAGGQVETFTATTTAKGRIAPLTGRTDGEARTAGTGRGKVGDRLDARTTHVLTVPAGTVISAVDRVQVNGTTYEVTAVRRVELKVLA